MTEAIVNKQSSTIINEESQKKLYTMIVYYGGQFVHIPIFSYTANTRKIYHNVDLEELSVQELKVCFGDILGEFDSLYYNVLSGIRLLTMTTKDEVIEMSKQFDNTATLYVYHQTPAEWDDDIDNFREDDAYSDYEFNEIRKATQEDRLRMNAFEKDYYLNNGSGSDSYTSGNSDYEGISSEEESDREVCYATPAQFKKGKNIEEIFNPKIAAKDIKWKVGLVFASKKEFKEAVRSKSMETSRPYQFLVDDLKRMQVGCAKECPFKMWATYIEVTQSWQIKTICNEHNCVWNYKNKLVTVKWLADKYGDKIRKNPNWKLVEMQEEFKKDLKVDVGEWKCCRVRQKALRDVDDKMREHYANIRRFAGEILRSNPNNTVKITTTRLQEGDEPRFQRMYICYDALKKSWKVGCRPVLGLDGCFLKTVCGGQLLSAVGRDGQNCILPVAMAVVESENYESWKWFLELLIEDLDLGEGTHITLISDQQKGLDKAIRELMPFVEHRLCTRHLMANMKKAHVSEMVRNIFWQASCATQLL